MASTAKIKWYAFLLTVIVVFVVHVQLAYQYMAMSYMESSLFVSMQVFLMSVIIACDILWMKIFVQVMNVPVGLFLQMVVGVVLVSYIPAMMNHTMTRFVPTKYVFQHFPMLCFLTIVLILSFFLPESITFFHVPDHLLGVAVGCTIVASIFQGALHWKYRRIRQLIRSKKFPLYKTLLDKINVMEEYYLILSRHSKLKTRPILTPRYCKIFRRPRRPTKNLLSPRTTLFPDAKKVQMFRLLGTIGYVAVLEDSVEIVLRGTQNIREWAGNILGVTPMLSTTDGLYKHSEINAQAHRLVPMILPIVKKYPAYPILMTGHSRGSTMALFLCQQLVRLTEPTRSYQLILFAPPPLFDPATRKWMRQHKNVRIETVMMNQDVMAYLHRLAPFGTAEIGKTILLDKKPHPGKRPMCFLQAQGNLFKSVFRQESPTWKAHRMDYYKMALRSERGP